MTPPQSPPAPDFCLPWHTAGSSIIDKTGEDVLLGSIDGMCGFAREEAEAERIVACVNALAGIRNPEAVKRVIEAAQRVVNSCNGINGEYENFADPDWVHDLERALNAAEARE